MADGPGDSETANEPARAGLSSRKLIGVLCGAGAALAWAAGLVAALHGVGIGLAPVDLALHRYVWLAPLLSFLVFRSGIAKPGGMSWGRGLALTLFAGPPLAILSYMGFLLVPLGHGAVIQPSAAAVGGLLLTAIFLHEAIALSRVIGALAIVAGLVVYAGESAATIGRSGILGDLSFFAAGTCWALFGLLLSLWRIEPMRATAVVTVMAFLTFVPVHAALFGFERIVAAGWAENLLQAVVQGVFAGTGGIYLFTRSVALLGPGRAAVFPALVPGFTMAIGWITLGTVPSMAQLAGFAIVTVGFALVLRR
ncbi:MAG: DMT family transporter [Bradyrhizobiaceae bacterium]|nr:DMT family transporter [Bradyrhizobiaceae bacterium]